MDRRRFVKVAGVTAAAGALAGCSQTECAGDASPVVRSEQLKWKMVTSWPLNFPGLGTGANRLAETITRMSGGRLTIKVYGANDLVPPFEVFDAVSRGTAEMGHSAAYYWKGKAAAAQFFSTVPFGLNAQEMNGWLYYGGGLALWRRLYEPFGIIPFPAGNSGVQMGGWFNKEINTIEDLKGLKMRIPGLGGKVVAAVGGKVVLLASSEIFPSLERGVIDACEWVGPYYDWNLGLHQAAKYYYSPGWHEPSTLNELTINLKAWNSLPKEFQEMIRHGAYKMNVNNLAEFDAKNQEYLDKIRKYRNGKIQFRQFPPDVLKALYKAAEKINQEVADSDPDARKVYESYKKFQANIRKWHNINEVSYQEALKTVGAI